MFVLLFPTVLCSGQEYKYPSVSWLCAAGPASCTVRGRPGERRVTRFLASPHVQCVLLPSQKAHWYGLLGSQSATPRPELLVSLSVEEDTQQPCMEDNSEAIHMALC